MNGLELKLARMRAGLSQQEIADRLGKTLASYSKKERGEVIFLPDEISTLTLLLDLDCEQFNCIFFDNMLPFRKKTAVESCNSIVLLNYNLIKEKAQCRVVAGKAMKIYIFAAEKRLQNITKG